MNDKLYSPSIEVVRESCNHIGEVVRSTEEKNRWNPDVSSELLVRVIGCLVAHNVISLEQFKGLYLEASKGVTRLPVRSND